MLTVKRYVKMLLVVLMMCSFVSCTNNQKPQDADAMFLFAINKSKDTATLVYWLTQAAEHGSYFAQIDLAEDYHNGQDVPQDDVRAYMWESLAIANTPAQIRTKDEQNSAQTYLNWIASKLTDTQVAKAKQMATEMYDKILATKSQ